MRLINAYELLSNLIMEFDDDPSEITKYWLNKIAEEIDDCQEYPQDLCELTEREVK